MSDLELQLATAQQELKAVYRERAHLVAALAALMPGTLSYADPSTPEWAVLTLDGGGEGEQLSWHIAPEDLDLFPHMPVTEEGLAWDGHSTEEKYERLRAMTAVMAEMTSALSLAGLPSLFAAMADEVEENAGDPEPKPEPEPEHDQAAPEPAPKPGPSAARAPLPKRTPRAKKADA
jgi:hypothetical protein